MAKEKDIEFKAITDGLGFHPFSDGLPYAPVTPKSDFTQGSGAYSAGRPTFVNPSRGNSPAAPLRATPTSSTAGANSGQSSGTESFATPRVSIPVASPRGANSLNQSSQTGGNPQLAAQIAAQISGQLSKPSNNRSSTGQMSGGQLSNGQLNSGNLNSGNLNTKNLNTCGMISGVSNAGGLASGAVLGSRLGAQTANAQNLQNHFETAQHYGFEYLMKRFLAYFVDTFLNVTTGAIVLGLSLYKQGSNADFLFTPSVFFVSMAFLLFFNWAIITAQEVVFHTSLGKKFFGLQLNGSLGAILIRAILFIPSLMIFGMGILWAMFNKDKRCWHDSATGVQPQEVAEL